MVHAVLQVGTQFWTNVFCAILITDPKQTPAFGYIGLPEATYPMPNLPKTDPPSKISPPRVKLSKVRSPIYAIVYGAMARSTED